MMVGVPSLQKVIQMAKIYAELIKKGIKTIDDVPEKIKEQVIKELNS